MNRSDILLQAKLLKYDKKIFKSSDETNLSLTKDGLEFVKSNFQKDVLTIPKMKDLFKAKDILSLHKVFKTPYYFDSKHYTIYHFDDEFQSYYSVYQEQFPVYLGGF